MKDCEGIGIKSERAGKEGFSNKFQRLLFTGTVTFKGLMSGFMMSAVWTRFAKYLQGCKIFAT